MERWGASLQKNGDWGLPWWNPCHTTTTPLTVRIKTASLYPLSNWPISCPFIFNIGNAGDHFIDHRKMTLLMRELGVGSKMLADIQDTVPGEIERAKFFLEVVRNG